ncbi:chromate resistance protein [Rhodococcus pseudokoreensis]|uniref:Chromate resistance protein n=1 Tax=Rhodococcus pseudokoreensis TaxID=2811421 RepID=A0A974ZVR6_9NOCA|nr:Chromate resistance protein ChrB [Rhodococcus pseudokoreensis]QSE92244.1 chromate resistance protein [Rhodococcus pseudokoreensis]
MERIPAPEQRLDEWVMLAYRIPREPSTPRIALWRKLRKYGVFQLADGVVVLPASPRTREQFDWVAEEVVEAGGQAEVWTAAPTTQNQQDRMRAQLSADRAAEYDELTDAAEAARSLPDTDGRTRKLTQLRRRMREIDKRSFFPTAQRDGAEAALKELAGRPAETQVPQ